jgi:formylglycine-generating enzyme required for sulfatase activity
MRNLLLSFIFFSSILSACSLTSQGHNITTTPSPLPTSTTTVAESLPSLAVSSPGTVSNTLEISTVTQVSVTVTVTPSPDFWKNLPIVPLGISERVHTIYQRGLGMGNNPNAFSKIGDCHSTNPYFLADYDLGQNVYDLGEYAYLQPTIDYFAGSFSRSSLATKNGLSTAGVLASLWSDWKFCSRNETPLDCEFRLHHPSIALISLGTNEAYDVKEDPSTFESRLRRIIEHSIDQGVVPILSTKADNDEGNHYINYVTSRLALEYELPLWNFWLAVQSLPQHGLRSSDHLTSAPTKSYTDFSNSDYLTYGMQMRNLTALQVLDMIRREITQSPASGTATPSVTPTTPLTDIHQAYKTMLSSIDGMELVYTPAGKFDMGSEVGNLNEAPVHTVSLDGYWLDRTEVTNEMFVRLLNAEGNKQEGGTTWLDPIDPFVWVFEKDGAWQTLPGKENHPIVNVSWYGAKAYCAWAGRDLPTEAQWEYAAKGTDSHRFPWGNDAPDCNQARFSGCGNTPVEAGSLLQGSNLWGVFDLAGNVAEWINDRYAADYYQQSPQENPAGPINGYYHVIRGGYWGSPYLALQSSHRDWAGADERINSVGFRCVLTP